MSVLPYSRELSVADATRRRVAELDHSDADLRDLASVLARSAADHGSRTSLDDVLGVFGHTRQSLAALDDDE
ncbi:hypothetical protein [Nocardia sp. NPDC057227]|uniref:hypothetical protein n=1 Tax=Nocardia sp. NPDC057227 TaxID=3346056 RepID=UPI003629AC9C